MCLSNYWPYFSGIVTQYSFASQPSIHELVCSGVQLLTEPR
jgi:hypothetical protein